MLQIADFEQNLGGLDPASMERDRRKLLQKDDELNRDVNIGS